MNVSRRTVAWALVGMVALAPLAARAGDAAERAADRRETETRIARIEDLLTSVSTDGPRAEARVALARRQVELARTVLARGRQRLARVLADQAERFLAADPGGERR